MLKVLGTRRMMFIGFDEFEKVMNSCFEVFTTWDDEYDKLQVRRMVVEKAFLNLYMNNTYFRE